MARGTARKRMAARDDTHQDDTPRRIKDNTSKMTQPGWRGRVPSPAFAWGRFLCVLVIIY